VAAEGFSAQGPAANTQAFAPNTSAVISTLYTNVAAPFYNLGGFTPVGPGAGTFVVPALDPAAHWHIDASALVFYSGLLASSITASIRVNTVAMIDWAFFDTFSGAFTTDFELSLDIILTGGDQVDVFFTNGPGNPNPVSVGGNAVFCAHRIF
jgi:hypothetical protein